MGSFGFRGYAFCVVFVLLVNGLLLCNGTGRHLQNLIDDVGLGLVNVGNDNQAAQSSNSGSNSNHADGSGNNAVADKIDSSNVGILSDIGSLTAGLGDPVIIDKGN